MDFAQAAAARLYMLFSSVFCFFFFFGLCVRLFVCFFFAPVAWVTTAAGPRPNGRRRGLTSTARTTSHPLPPACRASSRPPLAQCFAGLLAEQHAIPKAARVTALRRADIVGASSEDTAKVQSTSHLKLVVMS